MKDEVITYGKFPYLTGGGLDPLYLELRGTNDYKQETSTMKKDYLLGDTVRRPVLKLGQFMLAGRCVCGDMNY